IPDDKVEEAASKADAFDDGQGTKVENWADELNDKITPFFGGWQVQTANLLFVEPKKDPPAPPAQGTAAPPAPTEEAEADPVPEEDSEVIRKPKEKEDDKTVNVDLGCSGLRDDDKDESTLTTDGALFDS